MSLSRFLSASGTGLSMIRNGKPALGLIFAIGQTNSRRLSAPHAPPTAVMLRHNPLSESDSIRDVSPNGKCSPLKRVWVLDTHPSAPNRPAHRDESRRGAALNTPIQPTPIMLRSKHTKVARTQENSGLGKARETDMEKNPEEVVREILSFDTAKEVFEFLDATYLSIKSAYLVLQDLRKCGAQQRCIDVGIWARDVKMPLRNIHYTVLLGACRDLKDVKQAELFLHEMADRKEANLINYNAFFAVCAAVRCLQTPFFCTFERKELNPNSNPKPTHAVGFLWLRHATWRELCGCLRI